METEDPLVFIRQDGHEHLIFQEDEAGDITSFMFQNRPIFVYFKKSWFDTATFTLPWASVCLLMFLLTVLIWPLKYLLNLRRRGRAAGNADPLPSRIARWLAWGSSLQSLTFIVTFFIMFLGGVLTSEGREAAAGLFLIPPLTVVMTIGMVIFTVLAWWRRYWSLPGRVYYTLLSLAAVVFLGWLNYFNLF